MPAADRYLRAPDVELSHPEWSRNATIYQITTRQFSSDGTFAAATARLPRLKELGVSILWLMPVQPIGERNRKGGLGSPYSVRDYYGVNPELGTAEDLGARARSRRLPLRRGRHRAHGLLGDRPTRARTGQAGVPAGRVGVARPAPSGVRHELRLEPERAPGRDRPRPSRVDMLCVYYSWDHKAWPDDSIRMMFVSNHDKNAWEGTEYEQFGDAVEAAIVLSVAGRGMPLVHNGQEAGLRRRLQFFDGDPIEWRDDPMADFYCRHRVLAMFNFSPEPVSTLLGQDLYPAHYRDFATSELESSCRPANRSSCPPGAGGSCSPRAPRSSPEPNA